MKTQARRSVSAAMLLLTAATGGFALTGSASPIRTATTVAFYLLAPGLAVVGTVGLNDAALELALGIALSLTLSIGISEVMLWTHAWHPAITLIALVGTAAPLLAWRVVRPLVPVPAPGDAQ